jgi:hypothetical protein
MPDLGDRRFSFGSPIGELGMTRSFLFLEGERKRENSTLFEE